MSRHNRRSSTSPYQVNHQPHYQQRPRPPQQQLPEEQEEPIDVPNAIANMPVQIRGYRQLEPASALDSIAASNCLMVVQCIEPIEMMTGIETPNRYIVHDMYMRRMLPPNTPRSSRATPYNIPIRRGPLQQHNYERPRYHSPTVHQTSTSSSSLSQNLESPMSRTHKFQATTNGKWNPVGFAATELFQYETGTPLDRDTCEKNLEKLIKNNRDIDYYEFLKLAQQCHTERNTLMKNLSLGLAFFAGIANKQNNRLKKEEKRVENLAGIVTDKKGFSIDAANQHFNENLYLPTNKYFKLSDIVTPFYASQWTSSSLRTSLRSFSCFVFDKIALLDPYMMCYASSEEADVYIPIGPKFLTGMAEYALAGFGQTDGEDPLSYFLSVITDVLANKLNRLRKSFNDREKPANNSQLVSQWLKTQIAEGGFPQEELPTRSDTANRSYHLENNGDEAEENWPPFEEEVTINSD